MTNTDESTDDSTATAVAVITGGASGFGLALGDRCAAHGFAVALLDRTVAGPRPRPPRWPPPTGSRRSAWPPTSPEPRT